MATEERAENRRWRRLGEAAGMRARRPELFTGFRPYLATADVDGSSIRPSQLVSYIDRPARADLMLAPGDVLQAKMRSTNKAVRVLDDMDGWLASTGFAQFIPSGTHADTSYVFHCLRSEDLLRLKDRLCVGTTQQAISDAELASIEIPWPPPDERRQISHLLDVLDTAIDSTRNLIHKLERLQPGVERELLEWGVSDDGSVGLVREEFVRSRLGYRHASWSIRPLRECLLDNPQNGVYKPESEIGRGSVLIGQTAIGQGRLIDLSKARRVRLSPSELKRYALEAGDLLVSRVFATVDGVGQPALVQELPEPAVYESNMMRLRPLKKELDSRFLFIWLRSPWSRRYVSSVANASNQASINQRDLNQLPVPMPPPDEQLRIVAAVAAVERRRDAERATLQKLDLVRKGLSADLLWSRD